MSVWVGWKAYFYAISDPIDYILDRSKTSISLIDPFLDCQPFN